MTYRSAFRRLSALVPVYAAVVVFLTWPLGAHLRTHRPATSYICRLDPLQIAWALAHESRALVEDPASFTDGRIYHPARHALLYGEGAFGALPYFMPVFLVSGNPGLALNFVFLAALTLTACALHLVIYRWTRSHLGAALAAGVFLGSSFVMRMWGPCAPNFVLVPYLPLLVHLGALPAIGAPDGVALVGLAVAQGLVSPYLAVSTLVPLGVLAASRLLRPRTRHTGMRLLAALAAASAILALCYVAYLVPRAADPHLPEQTLYPLRLVLAVEALMSPSLLRQWHPAGIVLVPIVALATLAGAFAVSARRWAEWAPQDPPGSRRGRHPGRAPAEPTPPTAGSGGWLRRGAVHALLWTVVGLVLSLPPGQVSVPRVVTWPQSVLLSWTPLYQVFRDPMRLGLGALIGVCLLAGIGFASMTRLLGERVPVVRTSGALRGVVAVVLAGVFAVTLYAYEAGVGVGELLRGASLGPAYPITPNPEPYPPAFGTYLARGDGPLLELPAPPDRGHEHAAAMFRAIFHRRPLLNGYTGYYPAGFPARMQLAAQLPDAAALDTLRRETGLDTIIVHTNALDAVQVARWEGVAADHDGTGLRLLARSGPDMLFGVALP